MELKVSKANRGLIKLAGSTAMVFLLGSGAFAEGRMQGCALEKGVLPAGCFQANEGQVVSREVGANTEDDGASAVGDLGFSISIDPVGAGDPRKTIAGDPVIHGDIRSVDRVFQDLGIQMSYDGLGVRPKLNVSSLDMRRSYVAGDRVVFRAYSNYPAWIKRAEVRIKDHDGTITSVPIQPNGQAVWAMPASGNAEMDYSLRVYDSAGRYDETAVLPLTRTATHLEDATLDGAIIAAGEGEDRTSRRTIPVRGGAVTVTGLDVPAGTSVTVMGEPVILDARRGFIVQRILPPGDHGVQIAVGGNAQTRDVTIPTKEVFATGIVDITLGRDRVANETWKRGRIAGFADGILANGTRITASVDTREDDLKDLFRDFGRKNPDQELRGIKGSDVWVTTGDDSTSQELAPTSGKVYLKVEKDNNFLIWGDVKPTSDLSHVVRTDRTLYGLMGSYGTAETMPNGESRGRVTGYASQPDSLVQRDQFRGTGGSSYFLSRRDIQAATETLIVEVRDPVSGRIVEQRRLTEGRDYRIDYVQGLVILNAPLSPSAGAGGLVTDRPLGDYDVNLVAQYEYIPTTGDVSGISTGGRAEVWANDTLRFGVSGARDTTGVADNTLMGADVLIRLSEGTFLSFDMAQSKGPGFGSSLSLNGGLEIDPATPSAGVLGKPAKGLRVEGRADLADFGGKGFVKGYYDDREAGFSSPDQDIATAQTTYGVSGEVAVSDRTALTFGVDSFKDAAAKKRTDARLGLAYDLSSQYKLEVEASQTDRTTPGSILAEDNGKRTDLGARLTLARNDDQSLWVFSQGTVSRNGTLQRNNRLGFGGKAKLSDALSVLGEVSGGNLGGAGRLELAWAPNSGTTYTVGYRLDPLRLGDSSTVTGSDKGTLVLGTQSKVNDHWSYTAENSYSAFGSQPAIATTYGVSYTPSETWRYDMGIVAGKTTESDGTTVQRRGVSFGLHYSGGEDYTANLRGEIRDETSNNQTRAADRQTLLVSGDFARKTSDDWRLIGGLDAVFANADNNNLRDGTYVEAKLGYAYRPVSNDRLNALFSYTYLYDLPGADQVNVDGDLNGNKQRSHIVNMALNYDLNQQFTLGAKYGFRFREEAARGTNTFTQSTAHLGILRLDYHVVHNWDIMGEVRGMAYPKFNTQDFGALAGIYRDVGDNLRLGAGYSWGGVSDDLRDVKKNREGIYLNLIGKF